MMMDLPLIGRYLEAVADDLRLIEEGKHPCNMGVGADLDSVTRLVVLHNHLLDAKQRIEENLAKAAHQDWVQSFVPQLRTPA